MMDILPPGFADIVSSSSLEQSKSMLIYLNNFINNNQPKLPVNDDLTDFLHYTDHTTSFLIDDQLKDTIIAEVTSMGIINNKANKVTTQWLSSDKRDYCFSESPRFKHPPKPISEYPGIGKLLDQVNAHTSTTHDLDAALVMGYNKSNTSLNFHHDGEKLIDQNSSLAVVSFGSERRMEFCYQGGPKVPQYSVDVCDGDLLVMKPGCQQNILHRVCPGAKEDHSITDTWRFSISCRKVSPIEDGDDDADGEISFNKGGDVPKPVLPKSKISIIVGDSLVTGLDHVKLSRKGKQNVKNLSEGGAKIRDVSLQLDDFYANGLTDGSVVDKVFVSIGTNDIRSCKESGVGHLRSKLFKLISKIQLYFPDACIWFQSLLPLPIQDCWTVQNIEAYNGMLYDICSISKIFFLDCFRMFLAPVGNGILLRSEPLFLNRDNIHPNNRGLALIARKYLYLIHNRRFNPLAY